MLKIIAGKAASQNKAPGHSLKATSAEAHGSLIADMKDGVAAESQSLLEGRKEDHGLAWGQGVDTPSSLLKVPIMGGISSAVAWVQKIAANGSVVHDRNGFSKMAEVGRRSI